MFIYRAGDDSVLQLLKTQKNIVIIAKFVLFNVQLTITSTIIRPHNGMK